MKNRNVNMISMSIGLMLISMIGIGQVSGAQPEVVKIGALMSFSGAYAQWGLEITGGAEFMVEKINEEGGFKVKDKTYKFEIIRADTKTNVETAVSQANKLVYNDNIKFILGPDLSAAALAALPITEKNKVLMMSYGYTPKCLGPDKPYSYRLYASGIERVAAIFSYLTKNRPDIKKVACLAPNSESGWGTVADAKTQAKAFGIEVVAEDFVQIGTTDFFPVLTKTLAKDPGAILILTVTPGDTALFLQQANQLGYKGIMATASHYDYEMLIQKAGAEAVEGFLFQSVDYTSSLATDEMRWLVERFKQKRGNTNIDPNIASGYPTPWILRDAILKAGSLDTTAVAKAMEECSGKHPFGTYGFGGLKTYGMKHQVAEPIWLSVVKNGKKVGLGPHYPPVP